MVTNVEARDSDKLAYSPLLFAVAFYKGREHRNAHYCVNVDGDSSTFVKKFVNFGPVDLVAHLHGWWPVGAHMAKIR